MGLDIDTLAKPIDTSNIAQNYGQGVQAGVDIAARQAQIQQMKSEMQFKRTQLDAQMDQKEVDLIGHIANMKDDPEMRQAAIGELVNLKQMRGRNVSPELQKALPKSTNLQNALGIIGSLGNDPAQEIQTPDFIKKKFLDSGQQAPETMAAGLVRSQMLQDFTGGTVMQAFGIANEANKLKNQLDIAKLVSDRTLKTTAIGQDLNPVMLQQLMQNAQEKPNDPMAQQALQEFMNKGKTGKGIEQGQQKIEQGQQKINETGRHNLRAEDIAQQKVNKTAQFMGARLSLQQQRLLNTVETGIEKATPIKNAVQNIQYADNALDRLKPGMKWIDMYDVAADFNRLMSGNNRAAFEGEDRRTFTDISATWNKWRGKVEGKETGGPGDEEINIFRDRVEGLKDAYSRQHDNVYKRYWQGKVNTGLVPKDVAAAHFEANKLSENSMWGGKAGSAAILPGAKPNIRTGTPNPDNMGQAQGAQTTGPKKIALPGTLDQIRGMSIVQTNGKPDPVKLKTFLESHGYDSSGVQ